MYINLSDLINVYYFIAIHVPLMLNTGKYICLIVHLVFIQMHLFYMDIFLLHMKLIPLFTMDLLGHLNGLPGLVLSCVFSGSLR